nr:MAG TPA: hypothetical protein [Caudoviricetes sp.]
MGLNNPAYRLLCHGEKPMAQKKHPQKIYPLTPAITNAGVSACLSYQGGAI